MTVISLKIRAEALGKTIENIGDELENELSTAVSAVAHSAYSEAIRLAQERLHSTQSLYIKNLTFQKLDTNIYLITLNGKSPNDLEDGYPGFDIKTGLLSSPKAKTSKSGTRYIDVPIRYEPYSKVAASPKMTDLRSAVNALIKERGIDKIFKNDMGAPLQGVVARLTNTGDTFPKSYIEGLTKIQKTYEGKTESTYLTFRRVSSKTRPDKWIHPGFKGVQVFKDVEKFVEEEIDRIIEAIL